MIMQQKVTAMQYKMLIDGQWRDSFGGESWEVRNPASESPIATVPLEALPKSRRLLRQPGARCPAGLA